MLNNSVQDCLLVSLGRVHNRAGNITVAEGMKSIPFDIKRVYYLYDIPGGETRGGHAHKNLRQIIVAASGSFVVLLDDGSQRKEIVLNRPDKGLLIVPGIWRELKEFSSGAICFVIASEKYSETDYIRNYNEFLRLK